MTSEQYQTIKDHLINLCDFPFPASQFAMQKRYGPKNLRRLAQICNNLEVSGLLLKQAETEEIGLYRMGYDTPPLHYSIRKLADYSDTTEFVLLKTLDDGIDSQIFSGTILCVRSVEQKHRVFLSVTDSSGIRQKVSSNFNSPKLMTKDDYDTILRNRCLEPYYLTKNSAVYSGPPTESSVLDKLSPMELNKPTTEARPETIQKPIFKKGYYFVGGLEWAPRPIFVIGNVIHEIENEKNLIVKLEKSFAERKDGIVNVRSSSRRWIPQHLMSKLKSDNDFLESWINYQDKITELMTFHDRALLLEFFSKKDFIAALGLESPTG